MILQTNELKRFNNITGSMKHNGLLPILNYLKFDKGKITKNNLESFVVMDAAFEGSCLIDENILMGIVNYTTEKEIKVEINDKSVVLRYGTKKSVSPTDELINFPSSAESGNEEIEINSEVLNVIKVASNFTIDRENMPYTQCVFVGNGVIGATTGYIAYAEKIKENLPEIVLEKNAVSLLRNFDSVLFSQTDRHQFYSNSIFRFGYVKKETAYINMTPFLAIPQEEKKVEVNKYEVIEFCDTCINTCQGRFVVASVKDNILSMVDSAYGVECEHPISSSLSDFAFNPVVMAKLLKSLPDERVNFIRGKGRYYVTGAGDYSSLIMELQFPTNN